MKIVLVSSKRTTMLGNSCIRKEFGHQVLPINNHVLKIRLLTTSLLFQLLHILQASSQSPKFIHPSLFQIHFSLSDYRQKAFGEINNMSGGLGGSYIRGIGNHLDWQVALNATFTDSATKNQLIIKDKNLHLSADASLRARMFSKPGIIQPYLMAGFGFGKYKDYYDIYIPAGAGLQISLFKDAYLLSNVQYRQSLANTINSHFIYTIGIAGTIGKRKEVSNTKKAMPVPPSNSIPVTTIIRDTDNDGILDTADNCPLQPGLAIFQGCPDTDNDGIPDKTDSCPTIHGLLKYNGCPIPDRDKDGVNDEEDKCIDIPGLKENAGCPGVNKDLKKLVDLAAKKIYFETGSITLLPVSYKPLNEVINVLKENLSLKLTIEGHTDNAGDSTANESLSVGRATSVLQYFITQGITEQRLAAAGFGQKKPIADNKTIEGRARNRRVELHLSY
jgi:OmpA-OmpF porin, OOP family